MSFMKLTMAINYTLGWLVTNNIRENGGTSEIVVSREDAGWTGELAGSSRQAWVVTKKVLNFEV